MPTHRNILPFHYVRICKGLSIIFIIYAYDNFFHNSLTPLPPPLTSSYNYFQGVLTKRVQIRVHTTDYYDKKRQWWKWWTVPERQSLRKHWNDLSDPLKSLEINCDIAYVFMKCCFAWRKSQLGLLFCVSVWGIWQSVFLCVPLCGVIYCGLTYWGLCDKTCLSI